MKKIIACIVIFLFIFAPFAYAAKSKKSKSTKSKKPPSQVTMLKNTVAGLEAEKVSLTAKNAAIEKELAALKKAKKHYFIVSIVSGSIAVLLLAALIVVISGPKKHDNEERPAGTGGIGSEKHYEDLEYHVLNDWQNIWFHPQNIDMGLYDDVKNHWPDLYASMEDWKKAMNERQELALRMGAELSKKYPAIETMPYVYMLSFANPNLFVEENEVKSGPYVCAHVKEGESGGHDMMNSYFDSCIKLFSSKPYSEIKSLNGDISALKNSVDLTIRKIKFTREMPGECGYLKA